MPLVVPAAGTIQCSSTSSGEIDFPAARPAALRVGYNDVFVAEKDFDVQVIPKRMSGR